MHGALVDLVGVIERHVLDGRRSAVAYAQVLDSRGATLDGPPALKPTAIDAMRNKHTRCERPVEASSDNWRRCARAEK
jgi:hypothetical protein